MRMAYADPPYLGMAANYDHPDTMVYDTIDGHHAESLHDPGHENHAARERDEIAAQTAASTGQCSASRAAAERASGTSGTSIAAGGSGAVNARSVAAVEAASARRS